MGMMMGRMMIGWNEGYLALTLLIITNQLTSFNADGKDDGMDDVRMIWRIFGIRQAFFVSLYEQHILVFFKKDGNDDGKHYVRMIWRIFGNNIAYMNKSADFF